MGNCLGSVCPCLYPADSRYQRIGENVNNGFSARRGGPAALQEPGPGPGFSQGGVQALAPQPAYMRDEDADSCFKCGALFDMLTRRHHCRRCLNVFCDGCSLARECVLAFGADRPVRCCDRCKGEVLRENKFVVQHLQRLLEGGDFFVKRGLLGRRVQAVLRLLPSLAEVELTWAEHQDRVAVQSLSCALDGTSGFRVGDWRVESSSQRERGAWVEALEAARQVLPGVFGLKARIEGERMQRAMDRAKQAQIGARAEKSRERNRIAAKYNLAQRF